MTLLQAYRLFAPASGRLSRTVLFAMLGGGLALPLYSQVEVAGRKVEVHGFVSQGFAISSSNNYLTMKTSVGSFALTDGGINASSQISRKFRVGAQMYVMNIGHLGAWRPQLDWAFGDYKFRDWLGIRAGKVKTTLGLYTDVQDEVFLTPWTILPQSIYPIDQRASTIAHTGADVYGNVSLRSFGSLSYVGYAGRRTNDKYGGYIYGLPVFGIYLDSYTGRMEGGDLRWSLPKKNVTVGASYLNQNVAARGVGPRGAPHLEQSRLDETSQFYVEYSAGGLRLNAEYRRELRRQAIFDSFYFLVPEVRADARGFYGSASYSFSKRWQLGAYYSRYYSDWAKDLSAPDNHIFDKAAVVRLDINDSLCLKVEGHFMDGYGQADSLRGFYRQNNSQGLNRRTNMLVIRAGYAF